MNWIIPGKFLAFSGPAATRAEYYGYRSPVPEDYIDYFMAHNIQVNRGSNSSLALNRSARPCPKTTSTTSSRRTASR